MTLKTILAVLNDSRGIILSTDLMLSLIIITITLGMTANAMDMVINPLQDYSSRSNMEALALEATDLLINTPGSPADWEKYNNSFHVSPGLAKLDPLNGETQPHIISYNKLLILKNNYEKLMGGRVLPEYLQSTITLYPINNTLQPIYINENSLPPESTEIVVVNRTVMCDYQYLNCTLNISSNTKTNPEPEKQDICFHQCHESNSDNFLSEKNSESDVWMCKHFNISAESLNTTDYYLIIEKFEGNNEKISWILDSPDQINDQESIFYVSPLKLNDQIAGLIRNEKNAVLWLHVKNSAGMGKFNVYLVAAPKNTDLKYINPIYLNPQPCYFVLKVWIK